MEQRHSRRRQLEVIQVEGRCLPSNVIDVPAVPLTTALTQAAAAPGSVIVFTANTTLSVAGVIPANTTLQGQGDANTPPQTLTLTAATAGLSTTGSGVTIENLNITATTNLTSSVIEETGASNFKLSDVFIVNVTATGDVAPLSFQYGEVELNKVGVSNIDSQFASVVVFNGSTGDPQVSNFRAVGLSVQNCTAGAPSNTWGAYIVGISTGLHASATLTDSVISNNLAYGTLDFTNAYNGPPLVLGGDIITNNTNNGPNAVNAQAGSTIAITGGQIADNTPSLQMGGGGTFVLTNSPSESSPTAPTATPSPAVVTLNLSRAHLARVRVHHATAILPRTVSVYYGSGSVKPEWTIDEQIVVGQITDLKEHGKTHRLKVRQVIDLIIRPDEAALAAELGADLA